MHHIQVDFKGCILYVGSLYLGDVNQLLQTSGLLLNAFYIGYQLYKFHKKNKNEDTE